MEEFSDFMVGEAFYTVFFNEYDNIEWRVNKVYKSNSTETKIFQIDVFVNGEFSSKTPKNLKNLIAVIILNRKINPELFKEIFEKFPELFI